MVGVTWGANQVHTFGQGTSSATSTAAPPSAPLFGASSAPGTGSLFGSSAPAPAPSGNMFGAPAPSTSLFGSTAPTTPSPGLFGSSPAPTSSLFGAPAPSPGLFGSTPAPSSGGLFGGPPAAATLSAPAVPAQVAFQTYLDETNRQEAVKLQGSAEQLYNGYRGSKFVTIVYNEMTPEQRQWQWTMANSGFRHPMPPTPPTVSEREWIDKCVKNPDPDSYMPAAIAGAEALQTRLASQQDRAQDLENKLGTLQEAQASLQSMHESFQSALTSLAATHARLRQRLLDVMRKVELVRCRNLPLQANEAKLAQQLHMLSTQVAQLAQMLTQLQQQAQSTPARIAAPIVALPDKAQLHRVLTEQREALTKLSDAVQQDASDLSLLQQAVVHGNVPLPPMQL